MTSKIESRPLFVKQLNVHDLHMAKRWDDFVLTCSDATFFHRAGWQKIIKSVFHHGTYFLYAELDGAIQGILPLAHVKSFIFGNSLVSLPFAVYGGVASINKDATSALEREAEIIARNLGVEHLECRNVKLRHSGWPAQDLYVTFKKEIFKDDASNMQAIPRKQRAMVRKGIANGLLCEFDKNVDRFFALYADNVHRHGTPPMGKKYFEALRQEFGADCEVLTITSSDGTPLSSVMSFYFRNQILPYYAGDDTSARSLAANDFKYWSLMRRACDLGLDVFDFGRSKKGTGSFAFKKNWGFEPTPLHYEYCLYKREKIPQNNPSNKKFTLFIDAWRRLPIGIANWLGPYVVRGLG